MFSIDNHLACCIIPEIKKYFKNPLTNNDNQCIILV
nr:MAG TPA: hypothetical protein [Inoviridae sp.]